MNRIIGIVVEVTEEQIAAFCKGCDKLGENNLCKGPTISAEEQARYAERSWCGWAIVNGVRGQMTRDGFEPW